MNNAVKNGLFLGGALLIGIIAFVLVSPRGYLEYGQFVLFLIALIIMVKTGIEEKQMNGGFASFGQIFVAILTCIAVGYAIRFIGNYLAFNVMNTDLTTIYNEIAIESIEKMSGFLGDEATDLAIEEIEKNDISSVGNNLIQYISMLLLTGGVVNAIISLILKKDRPLIDTV